MREIDPEGAISFFRHSCVSLANVLSRRCLDVELLQSRKCVISKAIGSPSRSLRARSYRAHQTLFHSVEEDSLDDCSLVRFRNLWEEPEEKKTEARSLAASLFRSSSWARFSAMTIRLTEAAFFFLRLRPGFVVEGIPDLRLWPETLPRTAQTDRKKGPPPAREARWPKGSSSHG